MSANKKKTGRKSERRTTEKKQMCEEEIPKESGFRVTFNSHFTMPQDVQPMPCEVCGATSGQHCTIKHYFHDTPKERAANVLGLLCTCPLCAPRC